MKEKTDKILTLAMLALSIICAAFAIIFALNTESNSAMFDMVFWVLVGFIGVSIIAALFFLFKSLAEKGHLLRFFIGLAAIVAVLFVLFLISKGNDVDPAKLEKGNVSLTASKWIGAFCYLVYIIVIGAAGSIAFCEIAKSIKKK